MKKLTPIIKLIIGISLALSAKFFFLNNFLPYEQIGIMWIVFATTYIFLSLIIIFGNSDESVKKLANIEDGSRLIVVTLVLSGSLGAIVNVLILVTDKNIKTIGQPAFVIITLLGAICSWTLIHLVFTFHYAHYYYRNLIKKDHGLSFPEDENPDYLDFAYFSYTIGCTFQTSDVSITTKKMRRLVLAHTLLSFLINTFVVALTVNLLAGLN